VVPEQAPSPLLVAEAAEVRKSWKTQLAQVNTFLTTKFTAFNKKAAEHGSSTLFAGGPIQISRARRGFKAPVPEIKMEEEDDQD